MAELKRVLIMEDNRPLAVEWRDAFALNNCQTVLCSNGDEAIEYLETETFDVVITDLFVKDGKGGLSVLAHLINMREKAPPAITVTGAYAHSDHHEEKNLFLAQANRLGSTATIAKPFPALELVMLALNLGES